MGATQNEMLIWEGKDNKQLTTELSIRRRLDKYLRRALILEGWVSKHKRPIDISAYWLDFKTWTSIYSAPVKDHYHINSYHIHCLQMFTTYLSLLGNEKCISLEFGPSGQVVDLKNGALSKRWNRITPLVYFSLSLSVT